MIANQHHQFTPREVARALFRHRRLMVLFFCGTVVLTLLAIALFPRSYTSESKLFIRVGRESVALDPTATTGQTIMLQKTQLGEINSALQLLLSRDVFQRVVESVGAERILKDLPASNTGGPGATATATWVETLTSAKSWASRQFSEALASLRLSDPGTPEEMAIRKLDNGIKATAPKDSTVINVSYFAASPQLAHDVVDALTAAFLEQHVRLNHTEGSLEFFAEQTAKLQKEHAAAQAELRDRKNEYQVSTTESRRAVFAKQMEDVELQILATGRELAYVDAQIADLTRAIGSLQPELVTNRVKGFANEAKDQMRSKLYELEIEESKLRARYSENHPLLEQIQRQRKEAETLLTSEPDDRTQTTASLNPNQRALELDLLVAQAKRAALQGQQASAQKQQQDLNKELHALNDHEVQLDQLERNVQILDGKYRMHVEKLEQARVNDAMGRDKISNIKVAQPATFVGKPTSPKKTLLLGFGLIVATGGAFALAFGKELLDQTLRTTEQVENELGLPVLLSIPYSKRCRGRAKSAANAEADDESEVNELVAGSYRALARELLHNHGGSNGQPHSLAVGVFGCEATKARSRVAADLAVQAANCGTAPVLLIDADERHRRVTRHFGLNGSPGWREVVNGDIDIRTCVHAANRGRLSVMTPGAENSHSTEIGQSKVGSSQLDDLKTEYGLVVIDMPPASEIESPPSAGWLDVTVLVVDAEHTRIKSAQRVKANLERSGVRVAGVVLANQREHVPRWLYDRL
jgi:polysaccharide biosynthesis transport protein